MSVTEFADFMKDEESKCRVEGQEPEFPRNGSGKEDLVQSRDVDDEQGETEGDGQRTNQEPVLIGSSDGRGAPDGNTLTFGANQVSELNEEQSNKVAALSLVQEELKLSTSVEATLRVGISRDVLGGEIVFLISQPEFAHGDSSVVIEEVEVHAESSQGFDDTAEGISLKVDPAVEKIFFGGARLLLHDVHLTLLEYQRQARSNVGNGTDEDHEEGGQRKGQSKEQVGEHRQYLSEGSSRHKIAEDLLQVGINQAATLNSDEEGLEVVVGKNDGTGFLRNIGTSTHGNTNIGLLQGRGVVHTISSDGNGVSTSLHLLNNLEFVFRRSAGKDDITMAESPLPLGRGELRDFRTSDNDSTRERERVFIVAEEFDG